MQRNRRYRGWSLSTKSPELFRVCKAGASPILPKAGDTLVIEGILVFQMYQVNFMWHSKALHFKFWKLTCYSCVYEGILCRHFLRKMTLTHRLLTQCRNMYLFLLVSCVRFWSLFVLLAWRYSLVCFVFFCFLFIWFCVFVFVCVLCFVFDLFFVYFFLFKLVLTSFVELLRARRAFLKYHKCINLALSNA